MPAPLLVSTWSFSLDGHATAWPAIEQGGTAMDAVEAICRHAEDNPTVDSVGFGGLPDANGNVTVDGCVMASPDRLGGVAGMRRHHHAVTVARAVMNTLPHVLLVGREADDFADECGIDATPMCAPAARDAWERWTRAGTVPEQGRDARLTPVDRPDGRLFEHGGHDTIGSLVLDASGALAGGCSTSGMPFKKPGRVGDSPIIGHGLYVEPGIGAATATGVGERISAVCGAFLAVEALRRGDDPTTAARRVLERIESVGRSDENDQIGVVVLRADGAWGSAARREGFRVSITDPGRHEAIDPHEVLIP